MATQSSQWNNNTAFLLAATGSAVGLGNIWGFPYKAAENGGGLFVLLYIFFVITLGFPVFMAEVFIGKKGKSNPVSSVESLAAKSNSSKKWGIVGYAGILASLIIAGYYAVIAGFVIDYGFISAQGVAEGTAKDIWANQQSTFFDMTFWTVLFIVGSCYVVANGIDAGIDKAMRFLLPMLFILVLAMVGYGAYQGDFNAGINYLFSWKADDIETTGQAAAIVQAAIGQAFFSLSIGMGTLMAFGSYMPSSQKVSKASGVVVTADTGVALLAGLAIFPLAFGLGLDPKEDAFGGSALVFETMPEAFAQLGVIGQVVGPLFFFLLAVAAFSSMISILEPSVAFLTQKFSMSRMKATGVILLVCISLSLVSIAGHNVWKDVSVGALDNPFEFMKYFADDFLLLLVGTGMSVFVGWRLQKVIDADTMGISSTTMMNLWVFILKWVSPIFLMTIWTLGNLQVLFEYDLLDKIINLF
ncbi:MAG: hypothetical protein CMQ75_00240 [Gammaproteobacteria bacterium]|nr:hypothetical protein [Gammaproteobacteria bacterium]